MRCKAPQGIYVVLNSTEIDTLRVHVKQFPELTIVNILFYALNSRVVLEHVSYHQHKFVSLGHLNQPLTLLHGAGKWLLNKDMLSGSQEKLAEAEVSAYWCYKNYSI